MDKEEQIKSKLKKLLPQAEFSAFRYRSDENSPPNYTFLASPNENSQLKGSRYFFKPEKKLVHFTSLEALKSIIKNGTIRLYNLMSMNDPREFEFAGSVFFDNNSLIDHSKEFIFSISFCPEDVLFKNEKKDQFNLWRLYGKNGLGAAITFKFTNSPLDWNDHHISKVHYGDPRKNTQNELKGLHRLMNKLNETEPKIGFDFGKFFCFHKSDLYSYEREIRLIIDCREKRTGFTYTKFRFADGFEYPKIQVCSIKKDSKGHEAKFVEIPLNNENINNQSSIPRIIIENIILGHGFTAKEYSQIRRGLEKDARISLVDIPVIKRSNLTYDYWGKNF